MDAIEEKKVHAALTQAMQQLESAVREQERAVNRILGLTEELRPRLPDRHSQFQIDAIMEACAFQDVTGQRIRRVGALIKFLRDKRTVTAAQLPQEPENKAAQNGQGGLTQEQIDQLLAGGKPVVSGP